MTFNRYSAHRKVIRLQHYDYTQNGLYFITICTQDRACLFGKILDNEVKLNPAGKMIQYWYFELEKHFPSIKPLEYVIMPNHIHFILQIENQEQKTSLFDAIYWFKTMTTNEYIRHVKHSHWQPFNKRLWQRSYYEHIVRNERSYFDIIQYIENNPYNWHSDSLFYPD